MAPSSGTTEKLLKGSGGMALKMVLAYGSHLGEISMRASGDSIDSTERASTSTG